MASSPPGPSPQLKFRLFELLAWLYSTLLETRRKTVKFDLQSIPISEIRVADRQRTEMGDIEDLAQSIRLRGLLSPIIVQAEDGGFRLIAGERRLRAALALGWVNIPARLFTDLSPLELQALELDENIRRKQLTWQEEARAIATYHELETKLNLGQTWDDSARELGLPKDRIYRALSVMSAQHIPGIMEAEGLTAAYNMATRQRVRAVEAEMDLAALILPGPGANPPAGAAEQGLTEDRPTPPPEVAPSPCLQADFRTWAATYSGPPFNFIHCDFPYGISMDENNLQGTRADLPRYEDSFDLYEDLLDALFANKKIIAPTAHVFFWLSPQHLSFTKTRINKLLADLYPGSPPHWRISTFPLIWHKTDLKGILPDPNREGRRTYEMAIQISFGDRKIVRATTISCSHPTEKADAVHLSEKPLAVCEHFLKMYVDGSSRVLDPTCGSGNALAAAVSLGAASVLGLDVGDVAVANKRVEEARKKVSYLGGLDI